MSTYNEDIQGYQIGDDYQWSYRVEGDNSADCVTAMSAKFSTLFGEWSPPDRPTAPYYSPLSGLLYPLIFQLGERYVLIMIWVKTFYTP